MRKIISIWKSCLTVRATIHRVIVCNLNKCKWVIDTDSSRNDRSLREESTTNFFTITEFWNLLSSCETQKIFRGFFLKQG